MTNELRRKQTMGPGFSNLNVQKILSEKEQSCRKKSFSLLKYVPPSDVLSQSHNFQFKQGKFKKHNNNSNNKIQKNKQ